MRNSPYRLIVSLNLDRHEILVAGGGRVGERKIGTLLASGASVKLVSPDATQILRTMTESGGITWERRTVAREDFEGRRFAVLALPREILNDVAKMARAENCAIDACADGSAGDFALCAQFETDGCYVGVSSGGGNPAKAAAMKRAIKEKIQDRAAPPHSPQEDYVSLSPAGSRGRSSLNLTLLTRNSPLALAQAEVCAEALAGVGISASSRTVTSHGDRDRKRDLAEFGGFGAFVKALEQELLAGRGDLAVHSMKDMPAELPEGCVIAAVLPRESSRDILITRDGSGLESLPAGAVVGTSSLRRRAQVRIARRDLVCVTCRGNVETRLDRLERGDVDAIILAEAGLNRLGIDLAGARRLPFITSAGQGAIAIETLSGSPKEEIIHGLNHFDTWCEVSAERELLRLMGLGCACPIGVGGRMRNGVMRLSAAIYSIEPKENPEDEYLELSAEGHVNSRDDARALASGLWARIREFPLMLELSACGLRR
ncbi:MAG: hydroxymethylbilane synthase [Synergistaceae bacterium]|jgi:hydroxymethylbilane synthase|nr:hydroxymethylbilane synthase [Synergistaceae bacterium]